jgi:predicted ATP-dependent endonuclease of OLD family
MIFALEFKDSVSDSFQNAKNGNFFLGLERINLLIGGNNSGKSRFLRRLFNERDSFYYYSSHGNLDQINTGFNTILSQNLNRTLSLIPGGDFRNRVQFPGHNEIVGVGRLQDLPYLYCKFANISVEDFLNDPVLSDNDGSVLTLITGIKQGLEKAHKTRTTFFEEPPDLNRIYIPMLRGLRPILGNGVNNFSEDYYRQRTEKDYFKKLDSRMKIFTGLSLFEEITKLLLGDENQRMIVSEFQDFLKRNIFKKDVTLIPKYKEDVVHVKIGTQKQRPIYDLGDGLQALISILFPIFMDKEKESLVFIEEPETHLHPHWQRLLIEALSGFDKHQFFITTHSNVIINTTNTAFYSVKQEESITQVRRLNHDNDLLDVLKDLGYFASDFLQTNFILWVEGRSDVIYWDYLISKTNPNLKPGRDFIVLPFNGKTNIPVEERADILKKLAKLNQNFGMVIDSDRTSKSQEIDDNRQMIRNWFDEEDKFFWVTEFTEIENHLPFDAFKEAVLAIHMEGYEDLTYNQYEKITSIVVSEIPSCNGGIILDKLGDDWDTSLKQIKKEDLKKIIRGAIKIVPKKMEIRKVKVAAKLVELGFEPTEPFLKNALEEVCLRIAKGNGYRI